MRSVEWFDFEPVPYCSAGLLSPIGYGYLTTDDPGLKRRSHSFSKADMYMYEKRQEALEAAKPRAMTDDQS